MAALLKVDHVTMQFGGLRALGDVNFEINEGEIFGLIGPNGAGKTTLFNCVTGVYPPSEGEVQFSGDAITGKRPDQIVSIGICRTFQQIRLFPNMTALENVIVGADARHKTSIFGAILRSPRRKKEEQDAEETALFLLDFCGIKRYANDLGRNLSYGDQRRLEIARALATKPKLVLLDEPAAGMNPVEKNGLRDLVRKIRDDGNHRAPHRARHEGRDGSVGPGGGSRPRRGHRRRTPRAGSEQSKGHRGLPRIGCRWRGGRAGDRG